MLPPLLQSEVVLLFQSLALGALGNLVESRRCYPGGGGLSRRKLHHLQGGFGNVVHGVRLLGPPWHLAADRSRRCPGGSDLAARVVAKHLGSANQIRSNN